MSTRKTTAEKIKAAKIEKQQAEERIKKLLQEQKAEERKARNHRLCKRGGLVEKLLPDLVQLTDEQFDTFVEKVLLTSHTNRILAWLVPTEPEPNTEQEVIADTAQDGEAADAKPQEVLQEGA
jgi:NCAIR mutase (PurE)-related protein